MPPNIRNATINDLPSIVSMLADDFLGQQREDLAHPISANYVNAFREIENDPNNELIVAELDGKVIGTLQLTFTPSLSYQGSKRCTVESVRVDSSLRQRRRNRRNGLLLLALDHKPRRRLQRCRA